MSAKPDATCQNCGSPLYGEHCYACGQPTKGLVRHFSSILGDFADTMFNVDGRILRTLPALLFKPGFLTREYIDGHRVRYVSPVRLFVFLCIATFFAAKLATPSFSVGDDPGDGTIQIGGSGRDDFDKAATAEEVEAKRAAAEDDDVPEMRFNGKPWHAETNPLVFERLPDAANDWINAQIAHIPENWKRVREDPDLLRNAFYSALPTALFVLVPVFALLLKVLYVYRRQLYMEHLVSALHGHAFVCAMLLALMGMTSIERLLGAPAWLAAPLGWLEWLAMLWIPVYLWLHLKRVYRQGAVLTTFNYAVLGFAEVMLLSVVAVVALLAALVWL